MITTDVVLLHRKFNVRSLLSGFKQPGPFWEFPFISEMMVKGFIFFRNRRPLGVHEVTTGRVGSAQTNSMQANILEVEKQFFN